MILIIIKQHLPDNRPDFMSTDIAQSGNQFQGRIAGGLPPGSHPIQPVGLPTVLHQLRHITDRKVKVRLGARRSRLDDLDQRFAPAKDIADINILLSESGGGEIFAERRRAEAFGLLGEFMHPVDIMFTWIVAQRTVRPAVYSLLRLLIPIETEIAELQFAIDLDFTDRAGATARVVPDFADKGIYRIMYGCSSCYRYKKSESSDSLLS